MTHIQPPPPEDSGWYGSGPEWQAPQQYPPGPEQYPTGPQQYPSAPQMPPIHPSRQSQPPKPSSIRNAVRLMWVGATIGALAMVLDLAHNLDTYELTAEHVGGIVGSAIGGVIQILLWLWMAWKTSQGRRWARILSTIFAAVNLAWIPMTLVASAVSNDTLLSTILQMAIGLGTLGVGIVAVVLLWLKNSNEFFNASRRIWING